MIRVRIINKQDFIPFELKDDSFIIRWNRLDVYKYEYKKDEAGEIIYDEKHNPIILNKLIDSTKCSFWEETYSEKPSIDTVYNTIKDSKFMDLNSLKAIIDELNPEATESYVRRMLLETIIEYDLSEDVNSLYLNGQQVWFDKVLRTSIERLIQARKDTGQATAPIAFGLNILLVPVDLGLQMLILLEIYASDCYNTTLLHKAAILNLSTEEMVNYDYKADYPEKLRFNII